MFIDLNMEALKRNLRCFSTTKTSLFAACRREIECDGNEWENM